MIQLIDVALDPISYQNVEPPLTFNTQSVTHINLVMSFNINAKFLPLKKQPMYEYIGMLAWTKANFQLPVPCCLSSDHFTNSL